MAVQAQYPSNVLLFNRNVQEGNNLVVLDNNYSFLDQSQMILSNGGGVGRIPRKRGRESLPNIMNPLSSIQLNNPPQFMDLTQLQTPQPNAVSTGLRLAFGEQQQSQPTQHRKHQQLQQQQNVSPQSSLLCSILSEDLATQIRQQRGEIEQFLQAQAEQLRRTLADKRQRHYRALLNAAEETASRRLREKEAEIDKAARRNAELEVRAAQLTAQAQAWQARARSQEAAAAALQEQLQQAIVGGAARRLDEWGEEAGGEAEDAESVCADPELVRGPPGCRVCRRRAASVVLLPCRHLCLCAECGPMAQSCPLCLAYRESSVEILLS